jgi:hypothetical protein
MSLAPSCLVRAVRLVLLLLPLHPKSSSHRNIKCPDRLLSMGRLLHHLLLLDSQVSKDNTLRGLDLVASLRSLLKQLRPRVLEREAVLAGLLRAVQPHLRSTLQCHIPDLDSRLRFQPIRLPIMGGCNSTLLLLLASHSRNNSSLLLTL